MIIVILLNPGHSMFLCPKGDCCYFKQKKKSSFSEINNINQFTNNKHIHFSSDAGSF